MEFVGVEFAAEVGDALGEAGLRVADGLVVDDGADLFEEEVEEERGREIADWIEIFLEVAFEGGDGSGALRFVEFQGDHGLKLRNGMSRCYRIEVLCSPTHALERQWNRLRPVCKIAEPGMRWG